MLESVGVAKPKIQEICVENVHISFGGIAALAGVNFVLRRGEVFGLIGPNGAGKTTMVNVLSGFQPPTKGRILLDGVESGQLARPHEAARAGIGRTFQAGRLFQKMTVLENLTVPGIARGLSHRSARDTAMRILNWLDCGKYAGQLCNSLSYGQERRVGVGRALALDPAFVLLDEPASGMNDQESASLMRLIAEMPIRFDCGVLLIEHNMEVIMGACERIHVMDGGKSIAEGPPEAIKANQAVRRAYLGHASSQEAASLKAA